MRTLPIYFLLLFTGLILSQAFGQNPNRYRRAPTGVFGFAIKLNSAQIVQDPSSRLMTKGQYGFGIAITRDDIIVQRLRVFSQAGLSFFTYEIMSSPNRVRYLEATYLDIPIKLAYLLKQQFLRPSFAAGPRIRFDLDNSAEYTDLSVALQLEMALERQLKYFTLIVGMTYTQSSVLNEAEFFIRFR